MHRFQELLLKLECRSRTRMMHVQEKSFKRFYGNIFFIISYFTCATTLIGVFQIYWIYFRSGKRKIQGCNTCRLLEVWWERELEMRKLVQIWNWCTDAKHVNWVQSLIFLIFLTDFEVAKHSIATSCKC